MMDRYAERCEDCQYYRLAQVTPDIPSPRSLLLELIITLQTLINIVESVQKQGRHHKGEENWSAVDGLRERLAELRALKGEP